MHLYCSSGANRFEINEAFIDYTLRFHFHDTNLGNVFLEKQFVLNI